MTKNLLALVTEQHGHEFAQTLFEFWDRFGASKDQIPRLMDDDQDAWLDLDLYESQCPMTLENGSFAVHWVAMQLVHVHLEVQSSSYSDIGHFHCGDQRLFCCRSLGFASGHYCG